MLSSFLSNDHNISQSTFTMRIKSLISFGDEKFKSGGRVEVQSEIQTYCLYHYVI